MKQKIAIGELVRWALFVVLLCVGTFAMLMLLSEEAPDNPMTIGEFFVIKFGALATLYGLFQLGKLLYDHGLLPQRFIDELTREDEV